MEGKRKAADTTTAVEGTHGEENGSNGHDSLAKRARIEPVQEATEEKRRVSGS